MCVQRNCSRSRPMPRKRWSYLAARTHSFLPPPSCKCREASVGEEKTINLGMTGPFFLQLMTATFESLFLALIFPSSQPRFVVMYPCATILTPFFTASISCELFWALVVFVTTVGFDGGVTVHVAAVTSLVSMLISPALLTHFNAKPAWRSPSLTGSRTEVERKC